MWYFAYGSNMQVATFRGRRGIDFERALPARLSGWRIVFDKPPLLPIGEGFANLVPEPGAETFGVSYEIDADGLAHVDLTEGVLIGNYRRVPVELEILSTAETVSAFTLVSERRDPMLRPSVRYLQLLIEGATEHGLPEPWIQWLRTIDVGPETTEAAALRGHLDDALRRRRS